MRKVFSPSVPNYFLEEPLGLEGRLFLSNHSSISFL